ncbi:hypothetical protein DCAR_0832513 [Daucus carota subsp. sativus]|uniref:Uncharacterized protein n=1 Tax=Daucus carota subsp. sativus TaxID=79200 RepID=A0A175YQZ9_DAUCS|nr:PREDICTED: uncharacterized protein DDB_G0271670-like [Daucus carota subsp. sativus]WOH13004.1 hypothetical protein DCAR_0832513 [Daucus carota subsp. sativus]
MAMEVVQEDCGDMSMLCTDHPYKNNTPGGICALCLQEKLGKLVSSSFPITIFPSSSSSSSPSFRSDQTFTTTTTTTSSVVPIRTITPSSVLSNTQNECHHHHSFKISKIPYLLTHKKKKNKSLSATNSNNSNNAMIFRRSKSTATPRRGMCFNNELEDSAQHKKRFWSLRHFNKHLSGKNFPDIKQISSPSSSSTGNMGSFSRSRKRSSKKEEVIVVEENDSPEQVSFGRKVSRSRSVGCGSRSFSGDFFERISTGFGDCTLRRVESQREGKSKSRRSGAGTVAGGPDSIKQRPKCGGLFSGFMITSSSSSSSSSSYWVSSSTDENNNNNNLNVKPTAAGAAVAAVAGQLAQSRSKTWGWAFASPMRAFSKPKRNGGSVSNKNGGPNLSAVPSLLAVRS